MNSAAFVLLVAASIVAIGDWIAVATDNKPLEILLKPLTMVLLIVAVIAMDPEGTAADARGWFVAALALSMLGDIFLLWPDRVPLFIGGLASFLLGHVGYIGGMLALGLSLPMLLAGIVVVAGAVWLIGRRIIEAVATSDEPELKVPVIAYVGVISAMVATAFGTGATPAILGSVSFYASDAQIAWNRFISELPFGRLGIMTTYHLGQLGLVLTLTQ